MVIWKTSIPILDDFTVAIHTYLSFKAPKGSKILTIRKDPSVVQVWFETEGEAELVERKLLVIGTGLHFETKGLVYICTERHVIGDKAYVWHFYEVLES